MIFPTPFQLLKEHVKSFFYRCRICNERYCHQHDDDGRWLCADCHESLCPDCMIDPGVIESGSKYICVSCNAGDMDFQRDQARDEEYH